MLGGDAEHAADAVGALVFAFQKVGLLDDLAGAREEAHALFGGDDAGARTREDGDIHFAFKFRHRLGKAGLRDEELLRRRGERPGFGYLDDVSELLKFHGPYSSRKGRGPVGYSRADPRRGGVAQGSAAVLRGVSSLRCERVFAVVPCAGLSSCRSRAFAASLSRRRERVFAAALQSGFRGRFPIRLVCGNCAALAGLAHDTRIMEAFFRHYRGPAPPHRERKRNDSHRHFGIRKPWTWR